MADSRARATPPPPEIRNRITGYGEQVPDQFLFSGDNFRLHPRAQQAALLAILRDVGVVQTVIVNETTGHVIDGHLRIELAEREAPDRPVPFTRVSLTEEEERRVLQSFDPVGQMAATDRDMLRSLIKQTPPVDSPELRAMLDKLAPPPPMPDDHAVVAGRDLPHKLDADRALDKWQVEPGDIWEIPSGRAGAHRIACLDATDRAHVRALMGGAKADMMMTDPPYGVIFGAARKNAISGDLSQSVIPISFAVAVGSVLKADARIYMCGGHGNMTMYHKLYDHYLHQQPIPIIWVKDSFVLRHVGYHSQFEIVYHGWMGKGGSPTHWHGDRKLSDVWQIPRDRDPIHPTQKPVELCARAIRSSCPQGGIVYEPFAGSGSTYVAAETMGRLAWGMDIDPRWVAATLERMERLNLKPRRIDVATDSEPIPIGDVYAPPTDDITTDSEEE